MDTEGFYGKYRGLVSDNQDPEHRGRVRAHVPDIFGEQESGWALPSLPLAGDKMGFFAVPPVSTPVWIEFECGDPEYPIWSGCRWEGQKEVPKLPGGAQSQADSVIVICTKGGHRIVLDDSSGGGIVLETSGGQKLSISSQGIEIDNGNGAKITLNNNQVSINDGALEVQ
jgi:uncharacterized protein involved in type VI secretion and phage assembly